MSSDLLLNQALSNPDVFEPLVMNEAMMQRARSMRGEMVIARRVLLNTEKIESAIAFWKPIYFGNLVEGRLMNGSEAYDLGDPEKTEKPDPSPYIAMCNLMALEALRMLGDQVPTALESKLLAHASEREKQICKFWKETFNPTAFQADWAWSACLAVLAGEPYSTDDLLEKYKEQLP